MIWYDMIWCDIIWYDTMQCSIIWYDMIWWDTIWYDVMWCDVIWYNIIWYHSKSYQIYSNQISPFRLSRISRQRISSICHWPDDIHGTNILYKHTYFIYSTILFSYFFDTGTSICTIFSTSIISFCRNLSLSSLTPSLSSPSISPSYLPLSLFFLCLCPSILSTSFSSPCFLLFSF